MEKYISPKIELLTVDSSDIITTSPGVESPEVDLGFTW